MNTEETYFLEDPGEGYVKVPTAQRLWFTLCSLYCKQEGVRMTYETKDVDGKILSLDSTKPYPGRRCVYKKKEK